MLRRSSVVEQLAVNQLVVGSPARMTSGRTGILPAEHFGKFMLNEIEVLSVNQIVCCEFSSPATAGSAGGSACRGNKLVLSWLPN